jgi:hypothetical protein
MTAQHAADSPGLRVVYAVRFTEVAGDAALAALDHQVAEHLRSIDPRVKVTRGDLVPARSNPYWSAGFLHSGEPRTADAGPMPEMLPEDLALREQAEALSKQLGGTVIMVFLDGHWQASVSFTDKDHRRYYLQVTGGWK